VDEVDAEEKEEDKEGKEDEVVIQETAFLVVPVIII